MKAVLAVLAVAALLAACERERRDFHQPPSAATAIASLRMSDVVAGGRQAAAPLPNAYEENAYALAEGKRLYAWYNCNGCHAAGGGDKGPALMDDVWIYGSEPANVFATIVQGRPNGMPAFGGRIPEHEVWQIVAYVRSMSGQVDKSAAPSRNDDMQAKPAENRTDRQTPVPAAVPAASQR